MASKALVTEPQSRTPEHSDTRGPVDSRMNRIAKRAHEIFDARGGQSGKALDDWLQAEREIDGESEANLAEGTQTT